MPLNRDQLEAAAKKLIDSHAEAERRGEWTFFVDKLYAPDCIYICEYAGTMAVKAEGREQVKATHYGRDMQKGWEGWTFPYLGVYIGTENQIINRWMNRGPGKRPDGSFYETPGVSFITFDDNSQIRNQLDLFDLGHQMVLCDQLEEAGLLSQDLKNNWVIPMKTKLINLLK